jgi:hypothetical protein
MLVYRRIDPARNQSFAPVPALPPATASEADAAAAASALASAPVPPGGIPTARILECIAENRKFAADKKEFLRLQALLRLQVQFDRSLLPALASAAPAKVPDAKAPPSNAEVRVEVSKTDTIREALHKILEQTGTCVATFPSPLQLTLSCFACWLGLRFGKGGCDG